MALVPKLSPTSLTHVLDAVFNCARKGQEAQVIIERADVLGCIMTDTAWLQDNLMCMLSNAIHFSTPRSPVLLRTISCIKKADCIVDTPLEAAQDGVKMIRFEVEDFGVGVCEEQVESLFKAPDGSSDRSMGGAGLGLYCLAERVRALGGEYGVLCKKPKQSSDGKMLPSTRSGRMYRSSVGFETIHAPPPVTADSIKTSVKFDLPALEEWGSLSQSTKMKRLGSGLGPGAIFWIMIPCELLDKQSSSSTRGKDGNHSALFPSMPVDDQEASMKLRSFYNALDSSMDGIMTISADDLHAQSTEPRPESLHNLLDRVCPVNFGQGMKDLQPSDIENQLYGHSRSHNGSESASPGSRDGLSPNGQHFRRPSETDSDGGSHQSADSHDDRSASISSKLPADIVSNLPSTPLRVLIIDDSLLILKMLKMMFVGKGHAVVTTTNGYEALDMLKLTFDHAKGLDPSLPASPSSSSADRPALPIGFSPREGFDVVFIDIQMPIIDGLATMREYHKLVQKYETFDTASVPVDEERILVLRWLTAMLLMQCCRSQWLSR